MNQNWKDRRKRILERAGGRCEFCGVKNNEVIFRCWFNDKECYQTADGRLYSAENSKLMEENTEDYDLTPIGEDKTIKIVLTVAHLDHDEWNWNVKDERLVALCQRCHLRYDIREKKKRKWNKKAIGDLFE